MPRLTLFYCTNAVAESTDPNADTAGVRTVKLPCSSMIKDFVILRAFETGADGVIVLTCPEGQCRHIDGNIRAQKRVERVKKMLDSIGLDGRRLLFFNTLPEGDGISGIIKQALSEIEDIGPSPVTTTSHGSARIIQGANR